MFELDADTGQFANIKVIGVGGGGSNAVNRMIEAGFKASNSSPSTPTRRRYNLQRQPQTAAGQKAHPRARRRGPTRRSASRPRRRAGRRSARSEGADMVFVTAGMGGGTGTGAAPGRGGGRPGSCGALTVGVVTKPFTFEGRKRRAQAEQGIAGAAGEGGHADRDPQRPPAAGGGQDDLHAGGLPAGRRRAAPGRAGHLGPDHRAGLDQPGFRGRAHDHDQRRLGADGRRRATGEDRAVKAAQAGDLQPAAGDVHRRRPGHPAQHHRRHQPRASSRSTRPPRSSPKPPTPRRTSSSARSSTTRCRTRSG